MMDAARNDKRTERPAAGGVSRRRFVQASAAAAAGAMVGPAGWAAPAVVTPTPPNLLFINVDQLSHHALPQFGCTHVRTPSIDRLGQRGTSLGLSYSADPVCCPARTGWLTGRASNETGVVINDVPMRPEIPDLGQWLGNAGYDTFYCGKWHVPGRDVKSSFKLLHPGTGIGENCDPGIARACEALLLGRREKKPFFLALGLLQPHDICYWAFHHSRGPDGLEYPGLESELPPLAPNYDFDPREPEYFVERSRQGMTRSYGHWTPLQWRYYAWAYYRHIEMVDAAVGRVLDALEQSSHAKNTLLVFTADHGDGMGRHRLVQKMYFYDQAARVPLIVSWPGQIAAGRVDAAHLASGLDLTPTLCDYAGVAAPPDMRGRSWRPILEGRNVAWRDYVAGHTHIVGRMIRTARHKYITYHGSPTEQLFDLDADPWETKNLAFDANQAGTLAEHRKMLVEWESRLKPAPEPPGGWMKLRGPGKKKGPAGKKA